MKSWNDILSDIIDTDKKEKQKRRGRRGSRGSSWCDEGKQKIAPARQNHLQRQQQLKANGGSLHFLMVASNKFVTWKPSDEIIQYQPVI